MMRYSYFAFAFAGATVLLMTFACGDDEGSSAVVGGTPASSSGSSAGGSSSTSASGGNSTTTTTTTSMTGGGGAPCSTYPAGPYGNNMGDVMAPLDWEGYINPTGVAVSTADPSSYQVYGTEHIWCDPNKGPYAMVHLALVT